MEATFTGRGYRAAVPAAPFSYEDPLDPDSPADIATPTTRRALIRLALVAAETGARFQREGVAHDPMSWLLAPRALFHGASAIDACLHREGCLRGLLVHALSLGLDADPHAVDALSPADDISARRPEMPDDNDAGDGGDIGDKASVARLFTATVVANRGAETVQAFHASIATGEAEVAGRLRQRLGPDAIQARIAAGFDATDPLVGALLSPAISDTLTLIAADPISPLAAGLDLNVEQRFVG